MIVGKKDDGTGKPQYRMAINYQELNALTILPEYPLPTIQEILDMLHGANVFTQWTWSKDSIKFELSHVTSIKLLCARVWASVNLT